LLKVYYHPHNNAPVLTEDLLKIRRGFVNLTQALKL